MLKSKIFSRIIFFGMLILLIFACGCTDANVDTPADTTPAPPLSEIVETTPAETTPTETPAEEINSAEIAALLEKYTLVESLSSVDDVQRVGIKWGDMIVEAKGYVANSIQCNSYDEATGKYYYNPMGEQYMDPFTFSGMFAELDVPIIKITREQSALPIVPINNIEDKSNITGGPGLYLGLDGKDGTMGASPPYDNPGVYWMAFSVDYINPQFNEDILTPVPGEWYPIQEFYWIGVIVE